MLLNEVLNSLRGERGAVRVEVMPNDLCDMVVEEEATVSAVGGMLPVRNTGLDDFMSRNTKLVVFDDGSLYIPPCSTMDMVDSKGHVIGHDILPSQAAEYQAKDNVMFLSDDFIMFTDMEVDGGSYMNMKATPYLGTDGWVPKESDAIIWFSSSSSSDMIHDYFDEPKSNLATAMIGMNL